MKKNLTFCLLILVCFSASICAQIPIQTLVQISKAEDELRYDAGLENLMKSAAAQVRTRAALAAGRIGDEDAIPALANLLQNDKDVKARATAAFALGEIESIKAADVILQVLKNNEMADSVRARATEAAGKIAAANAKDEKAKQLGEAILDVLETEDRRGKQQSKEVVLLGITAALRARPEEAGFVVAKFLTNLDARIRADAANTLARIRAKTANEKLRAMLLSDDDPVARANAGRALGAAEDKDSFELLLEAAISDDDSRVRVSAIRSVGSLKDAKAADKLLERGEKLLADYEKSKFANPVEKNELLEIAATLGRILPNTNNEKAVELLKEFRKLEKYKSPEIDVALVRITPKEYLESVVNPFTEFLSQNAKAKSKQKVDWQVVSTLAQGVGEIANLQDSDKSLREKSLSFPKTILENPYYLTSLSQSIPDVLRAYAAFKTDDLVQVLRKNLEPNLDVFTRAAAAELLGDMPASKENVEALKMAFGSVTLQELMPDKTYNDAQLAVITALAKQDKEKETIKLLFPLALQAPDYLVRHHTATIIKQSNLENDVPEVRSLPVNSVLLYNPKTKTKLGQVLNTSADYKRAVSRKNGTVKAVLATEKGTFTIDLLPEDAPLTVDNFIKLARSNYFNGVAVHRVVPNFVMQDGDPRGDGNGGPGWSIRCEINMIPYERGAVGMALSGKDTGGSQWFVTHSPQPHLDGGYTVFGRVSETNMKIVDSIVRGDKILSVKIVENSVAAPKATGMQKSKTKR